MIDFLETLRPDLADYILLALLQLLMHLLTVIEVASGNTRTTATADIDRTRAATWSFTGVILTLLAGIMAKALADRIAEAWALAVPLFFIGRWAFFHWRISKLLDGSVVETELHDIYRRAISRVFEESNGSGLTSQEVSSRILPYLQGARLLYGNAGLFKRFFPVSLGTVFDRLLPTPENLTPLIDELVRKEALENRNGTYYRSPSAANRVLQSP